MPGGGLDAVGAVAEVGDVEVALEDPVLGVLLLEGDRVAQLAELALVGVRLWPRRASLSFFAWLISVCLTICWVIDEPPCTTPEFAWLVMNARSVPLRSSAPCS